MPEVCIPPQAFRLARILTGERPPPYDRTDPVECQPTVPTLGDERDARTGHNTTSPSKAPEPKGSAYALFALLLVPFAIGFAMAFSIAWQVQADNYESKMTQANSTISSLASSATSTIFVLATSIPRQERAVDMIATSTRDEEFTSKSMALRPRTVSIPNQATPTSEEASLATVTSTLAPLTITVTIIRTTASNSVYTGNATEVNLPHNSTESTQLEVTTRGSVESSTIPRTATASTASHTTAVFSTAKTSVSDNVPGTTPPSSPTTTNGGELGPTASVLTLDSAGSFRAVNPVVFVAGLLLWYL